MYLFWKCSFSFEKFCLIHTLFESASKEYAFVKMAAQISFSVNLAEKKWNFSVKLSP